MTLITLDTPVQELKFSVRTANCLRRGHIDTVAQLLDCEEGLLMALHGFGKNSLDEVNTFTKSIREGTNPNFKLSDYPEPKVPEKSAVSELLSGGLEVLALSNRSYHALMGAGITTLAKLSRYSAEELAEIPSLGFGSVNEILQKVNAFSDRFNAEYSDGENPITAYAAEAEKFFGKTSLYWTSVLFDIQKEKPDLPPNSLCILFSETPEIAAAVQTVILKALDYTEEGILPVSFLEKIIPECFINTTLLSQQLIELEGTEQIKISEDGYYASRLYPSVLDALQQTAEHKRAMILDRFSGLTLEEIGTKYGRTRERVRQVISNELGALPRVREDRFRRLFDTYALSAAEFCVITGEPKPTFYYLSVVSEKKPADKRLLEDLPGDESFPIGIRKNAERELYKDFIVLDGMRVRRDRQTLVRYYVGTRCKEKAAFEEFVSGYNAFLDSIGETSEKLRIAEEVRSYENRFARCDYMLANTHHCFRYYEVGECDPEAIMNALHLEDLHDIEISALKLFREHPDTMAEFDIRDEYELHNLLNKLSLPESLQIKFGRMPMMTFGTADRQSQLMDLLIETAPITAAELAQKYEEKYGVRAATIQANEFKKLYSFFFKGVYRIDDKPLPPAHKEILKPLLTEDCYAIDYIRSLYAKNCKDADMEAVNSYSLKELGFRVYTGYVVSDRYENASAYIQYLFTKNDIVNIDELPPVITCTREFYNMMNDARAAHELIEFAPNRYIRFEKLRTAGITMADIEDYCEQAANAAAPGEYFTIGSLYDNGFTHKLDELGFEPLFYASLLAWDRKRFSFRRAGGSFLLFNAPGRSIDLAGFIRYLVEKNRRLDIDDLEQMITEQYGLRIFHLRDKFSSLFTTAGLYYDKIMQAVYVDYDTFFEEI